MKRKTTGKSPSVAAKTKKIPQGVKTIEKKLALIGYVRGKDWSPDLIQSLHALDLELNQCQQQLRVAPAHSEEESVLMERVKALEIERFQMLGQVHGNKVNDYHVLTS